MYKKGIYKVLRNENIADSIYEMVLEGDTQYLTVPGQFVNIQIDGFYLRRPISVCSWNETTMTLVYKVVGKGTAVMASMEAGTELDLLTGLGNGFTTAKATGKIAVVGGGVGIPPLYALTQKLVKEGKDVFVVLGCNNEAQLFYQKEFEDLGVPVHVATVDGSCGTKGFVTDVLKQQAYDYYFTCGPEAMLKAIYDMGKQGQLSFEERMGCGFGACMGCSCETIAGVKRICVEGPVMESSEVIL